MLGKLKQLTFYVAWLVVVFAYQFLTGAYKRCRWEAKQGFKRLIVCLPAFSPRAELINLAKVTKEIKNDTNRKIPKHLAISVFDQKPPGPFYTLLENLNLNWTFNSKKVKKEQGQEIDLQALAKVITWAYTSDINFVSLYDNNGVLKSKYHELGLFLQDELIQSMWALNKTEEPPSIKFHNVPHKNGYCNGHSNKNSNGSLGLNGFKQEKTLHICLLSFEDGRPAVVDVVKNIFKEIVKPMDSNLSLLNLREELDSQITETVVGSKLNDLIDELPNKLIKENANCISSSGNNTNNCSTIAGSGSKGIKTDPDLLVILDDSYRSTVRFRPWQIHLTEIHWLPRLQRLEISDFLKSLQTYAKCHQRFGT